MDPRTCRSDPATVISKTYVTGLTRGTIYYFRFRTLTVGGLSDWSMPVSLVAH